VHKRNLPGLGEITVPALLLTTTGRKSGEKFKLYYGTDGDRYFVIASKGARPNTLGGTAISSPTRMSRCKSGPRS
jgi:proline iminopeptidase